jgi:uncharacterized membrane protein YjdF
MNEEYKLKTNKFLERQLVVYQKKIKKLKKKRWIVKAMFANLIVISLASSMVCATLSGLIFLPLPLFLLPILNMIGGMATALSVKFNLEGRKNELNKTIEHLDKIQQQIDYVISCNGNFTEVEYKQVMVELSHLG